MSLPEKSYYKPIGATWVLASFGEIPPNAIPGGEEANGEKLYIARFITKQDQMVPGKLVPHHGKAFVTCGGEEQSSHIYQVLTHPNPQELKWISTSGDSLPTGAIQAGRNSNNPLYIGRAPFQGGIYCGKYDPQQACLYLTWGGRESSIKSGFEVLCLSRILA